ncbi:hypothetical protein GLOIN_2v1814039 [Rhizophagus irregularis DAOM 181602=DAOM 197198]|uniref:Transposable element P transposase-like RNase H domain-containing protein n=1 Tax=Rhizophagus irregularis (strain DAOM 181602 / DAOM 197198 / MUCL 43194) TaxID=747089 RepID=A0A2P4P7U3_RHIID|nr:hypothetical protein GLOIN_2v1814039 [Rhizophagus irregularis DAOM 181602=DAOM 197198]POG61448.1 hypothetical protein GLOIN_2v1814039 [Rhizophagus irregularis DAOM 181602=DAOM 197198]|eukprot:XP_025168314.1 hypothetical protein GLOIN_2v1814039 [Rhizophagus irregularis DAOM 181602=DAOM 197198]
MIIDEQDDDTNQFHKLENNKIIAILKVPINSSDNIDEYKKFMKIVQNSILEDSMLKQEDIIEGKKQYREGLLIYDKQDKIFYVFDKKTGEKFGTFGSWIKFLKVRKIFSGERSALATIFFEPNSSGSNLASLLRTEQSSYWKNCDSINIAEVTSLIKTEFFGVGIRDIINGIGVTFFGKEQKIEKYLIIKWQKNLISYELYVLKKSVKEINGIETGITSERTISEISRIIHYISMTKICTGQKTEGFEKVVQLRGIHLVRNQKNSNNIHEPFAILENQNQPQEAYRRIDCHLLVTETNVCKNCQKLKDTLIKIKNRNFMDTLHFKSAHASQEVLSKKIQIQRKKITSQEQKIRNLQLQLQQKVEEEEEVVSEELGQIAKKVARDVREKKVDLSSFNPMFQELIRIQSGKVNGVRYHPMFLRWAISVYSRAGNTAYEAMKGIMRLPSVSTIKNYINESQQCSGWQIKTAYHILEKMAVENIGNHGRIGFFSHDSFKIQKGLLWSQRDNRYVGYLDFENEKEELQSFIIQCEKELQGENTSNLPNLKDNNRDLATQVHQIIWHSATYNFAYPIAYYGINTLDAHEINKILFQLAANLECIGIHTYGSVCDGAGENRNHIKSFDWWAFSWSLGDIVEVDIGKNNYERAKIIATSLDRSKFTVQLLDSSISSELQEFVHYSCLYRQIFHRKKPLKGLADSRLQTLKKIYDWFVIRDHQKISAINWISSQCQFDLLLSIQGFLGMTKEIFTLHPNSTIEPRRVSKDMLKGLFGTIRQLGGDSSTQKLKGYGHALNKFQMCIRDRNNSMHSTLLSSTTQLSNMPPFVQKIFKALLLDDLFMGRIEIQTLSFSEDINQLNQKVSFFQKERQQFFNSCLYNNRIFSLLEKWNDNIKNIVLKLIPKKKGKLWSPTWITQLEVSLNNYLCSGIWFLEFQEVIVQNHSTTTT